MTTPKEREYQRQYYLKNKPRLAALKREYHRKSYVPNPKVDHPDHALIGLRLVGEIMWKFRVKLQPGDVVYARVGKVNKKGQVILDRVR